jgi:hypothetical protein
MSAHARVIGESDAPQRAAPAPLARTAAAPARLDARSALALQRTAGNRAVAAMVARRAQDARGAPLKRQVARMFANTGAIGMGSPDMLDWMTGSGPAAPGAGPGMSMGFPDIALVPERSPREAAKQRCISYCQNSWN